MTHEEFQKKLSSIPDQELFETANSILSKLCKNGGKSFVMNVPPRLDDTDIVIAEVLNRFRNKILDSDIKHLEDIISQEDSKSESKMGFSSCQDQAYERSDNSMGGFSDW